MHKTNGFHIFSAVTFAVALILIPAHVSRAGTYLQSAHGGNGVANAGVLRPLLTGYSVGNCAHCHEQHASVGGLQPAPLNPEPSNYMLFETLDGNIFCDYCHNSAMPNGADNISTQISKAHSHDPGNGNVLCNDCHDSHEATTAVHFGSTGNIISGALKGIDGVAINWGGAPSPPTAGNESINPALPGSLLISKTLTIANSDKEYELCFKCHAGQTLRDSTTTLPDLSGQFNPGNFSVHPVTTSVWKNTFLSSTPAAMKAPWKTPDTQMYCSDCHASNAIDLATDPAGPHGSTNIYLLRGDPSGFGASLDYLCETCHNVSDTTGASSWVSESLSPAYPAQRDHDYGPHKYPGNSLGCVACHGGIGGALESSIHGANYKWPDEGANPGNISTAFLVGGSIIKNYTSGGNRFCAASCHTGAGSTTGYRY